MPGARRAKTAAKENLSQQQTPSQRRRERQSSGSGGDEDEADLMPPPSRQRKRVNQVVSQATSGSVSKTIMQGRADIRSMAQDWVELYKSDRDAGLLQMYQLFIEVSGCKGVIDEEMQANLEFAEIIRKMTEEFDEDSAEYPLTQHTFKKLRSNLTDFIQFVIKHCQSNFVYDGYMVDNLSSFLTGLTDSQVRAFRHTSTLITMKLMTAIVDIAVSVERAKENARQQYESEKQKHQSKKASERLNALQHKKTELDQNHTELLNMLTFIFRGVFVFRYRDVVPDIRSICIHELGLWIIKLPSLYLEDSYLKYLGWTLYDRVSEVRLTCVRAITNLYELGDEFDAKLELFTARFKDRIVEMTLDKDFEVAVAAVKLMLVITKKNPNVMTMRDGENVYELVFSSNRGVATAAAEFLNYKMIDGPVLEDEEESQSRSRSKKSAADNSQNHRKLRTAVQFFHESELHEHATYLVDALWDVNTMLKDWKAMTDLLLDETVRDDPLNQDQETRLIDIMACCVHQASTGDYPPGRGSLTRKLTAKEAKQARDDRYDLTEHFIETLPQLLTKYGSDKDNVNHLLRIATHFDLEVYTTSRKDKHLQSLLNILRDIVEKQSDQTTLQRCADVLDYLSNEDYAIWTKVNLAKSALLDSIIKRYKDTWLACIEEGDSSDEAIYSLYSATKKLHAFSAVHTIHTTPIIDIWESVTRTLKKASKVPDEIIVAMINIGANILLWYLKSMDNKTPDKSDLKSLKKKTNSYMKILQELLLASNATTLCEAFVTVCDLLVVFSPQLATLYPALEPLVYEASEDLQQQLCSFLTDYIFTEDDQGMDTGDDNDKIDEMHSKRRRLAAFAKLITCNIIPMSNSVEIFKNYVKFYNDYGDIIKFTLTKVREISKIQTAQTLAMALTKLYEEIAEDNEGVVDSSSAGFGQLKDLARRFTLTFGVDQVKNRESVAALHKQGIQFALKKHSDGGLNIPPNLSFFDVLCEFVGKLLKQDRRVIGSYLDRSLATMPPHQGDEWVSLHNYRNMLVCDDDTRSLASTSVSRPRGRTSRQARTPANRGHGGPLASTAIKSKRGGAGSVQQDDDDVQSVSASISALSTGSGQGSDGGSGRLMTSVLSEEGESLFSSPSRPRPKITMRLPAPSELLPEGAEGADESDLENFLME